jgi:hypothetical protein
MRLEFVKRSDDVKGFVVLPRRTGRGTDLLLVRPQPPPYQGYENLVETLAAFVALACIQIAVRRLAR